MRAPITRTAFAVVSVAALGFATAVQCQIPAQTSATAAGDLHAALMAKVGGMNAAHHGMFDEDVTALFQPYFPPRATFSDVERTLVAQHFAPLHPFRGRADHDGMAVFVSHTDIMTDMASTTRVVLDFEFTGAANAMVLRSVRAHVRAASM